MAEQPTKKKPARRKARCSSCTALRKEVSKLKAEKAALDKEADELYDVVHAGADFLGGIVKFMEKEGME